MRYTTKTDAISQAIAPAFHEPVTDDYLDAIFAEAFEYKVDKDAAGNELLNTAGFEQVVSVDEFWKIAERLDRSA